MVYFDARMGDIMGMGRRAGAMGGARRRHVMKSQ